MGKEMQGEGKGKGEREGEGRGGKEGEGRLASHTFLGPARMVELLAISCRRITVKMVFIVFDDIAFI